MIRLGTLSGDSLVRLSPESVPPEKVTLWKRVGARYIVIS